MRIKYDWLETAEILLTASGCLIAALSLLVFSASCISAYHHHKSNAKSQLVFMGMMYPAVFIWGFLIAVSIAAIFVSAVLDGVCNTSELSKIWKNWDTNSGLNWLKKCQGLTTKAFFEKYFLATLRNFFKKC